MNSPQPNSDRLIVLIATAGGGSELADTLASLERCHKPDSYLGTVIVENGKQCGAQEIVERFRESLGCEYRFVQRANKSFALNEYLGSLQDNSLIYFSDDDIDFDPDVLLRIDAAARAHRSEPSIFGGRVHVKSDADPPPELVKHLPGSMTGFPRPGKRFDPQRDLFLGANWAAYSRDIAAVGGFDPRFGPGSPFNATGQESEIMKKLRAAGFKFVFVDSAIVWHSVEPDRFNEQFVASRLYRSGVQAGLHWQIHQRGRGTRRRISYRLRKWLLPPTAALLNSVNLKPLATKLKFSASHASGFIDGSNAKLD